MQLRVFFGNVGLAGRLGSEETAHDFLRTVRGWQSLSATHVRLAKDSQLLLLPVCRDTHEWSLLVVTAETAAAELGFTTQREYLFLDRLGKETLAQTVVEKAQALFSWDAMPSAGSKPSPKVETYGIVEDKRMSSTFMLGVVAQRLAQKAGMETKLPTGGPEFLAAVQDGLAASFG